jgi:hypothetical protein
MALNTLIMMWYTITMAYYSMGFVLFGIGFLNYIPEPRFGLTWGVLVITPFSFILPVVIISAYSIYVIGNKALREIAGYFVIFVIFAKTVIILYLGVTGLSCRNTGTLCSYVPSDGVPDDPTKSTTFMVIWIWSACEYLVVGLMGLLWAFIPFYATQAQKELVKDSLAKKFGNEIDVNVLAECLVNDGDMTGLLGGSGGHGNNNNNMDQPSYFSGFLGTKKSSSKKNE